MLTFNTIHEIQIEGFGDFSSVMKDAQALAILTNKRVKLLWNGTKFVINGTESFNVLWEHHQREMDKLA